MSRCSRCFFSVVTGGRCEYRVDLSFPHWLQCAVVSGWQKDFEWIFGYGYILCVAPQTDPWHHWPSGGKAAHWLDHGLWNLTNNKIWIFSAQKSIRCTVFGFTKMEFNWKRLGTVMKMSLFSFSWNQPLWRHEGGVGDSFFLKCANSLWRNRVVLLGLMMLMTLKCDFTLQSFPTLRSLTELLLNHRSVPR